MSKKFTNLLKKLKYNLSLQLSWFSTKCKYKLRDEIQTLIDNKIIKPRKHPGIIKNKNIELPQWIAEAINDNLKDIDKSKIYKESLKLNNYLFSRQIPLEEGAIQEKYLNIQAKILKLNDEEDLSEDVFSKRCKSIKAQVLSKFKKNLYAWKPVEYNKINCLLYLVTRCVPEYFVLTTIFNEIKTRDLNFKPQTVCDFGSGAGSVLWAAIQTWHNINQYMGIDISNDMNNLFLRIVSKMPIKVEGIFHRRFVPLSNVKYDLIVSAYSLMELPNVKQRLDVILKLWQKTKKYLVIIEQGTNNGFKVINEAREFINRINSDLKEKYFIFAPCSHLNQCPRYIEGQSPCNFANQYLSLNCSGPSKHKLELFSYIVFKKGESTENDNWCRVVRNTVIRKNHVQCNLCTSSGKLEQIVFKKKNEKSLYKCAIRTRWGDLLPIEPNI